MSELEYEYALKRMKQLLYSTFINNLSDDEIISIMFEYKYGYKYDFLRCSGECHRIGNYILTRKKQFSVPRFSLPRLYDGDGKINNIYKNVNINIRCYAHKDIDEPTYAKIISTYQLINSISLKYKDNPSIIPNMIKKDYMIKPSCSISPEAKAEMDFIEALSSNLSEKIPEEKKKLWIDEYNSLKQEQLKENLKYEIDYKKRMEEIAQKKKDEEDANLIRENELKKENEKKYNDTYNMLMNSFK